MTAEFIQRMREQEEEIRVTLALREAEAQACAILQNRFKEFCFSDSKDKDFDVFMIVFDAFCYLEHGGMAKHHSHARQWWIKTYGEDPGL